MVPIFYATDLRVSLNLRFALEITAFPAHIFINDMLTLNLLSVGPGFDPCQSGPHITRASQTSFALQTFWDKGNTKRLNDTFEIYFKLSSQRRCWRAPFVTLTIVAIVLTLLTPTVHHPCISYLQWQRLTLAHKPFFYYLTHIVYVLYLYGSLFFLSPKRFDI